MSVAAVHRAIWALVLLQLAFGSDAAIRGVIETCPACRLNSLPEVKQFVMEQVKNKTYNNLRVNFIPGRDPVLIVLEDDKEVSRISLDEYSYVQLHKLVKEKLSGTTMTPRTAGAVATGAASAVSKVTATAGGASSDRLKLVDPTVAPEKRRRRRRRRGKLGGTRRRRRRQGLAKTSDEGAARGQQA